MALEEGINNILSSISLTVFLSFPIFYIIYSYFGGKKSCVEKVRAISNPHYENTVNLILTVIVYCTLAFVIALIITELLKEIPVVDAFLGMPYTNKVLNIATMITCFVSLWKLSKKFA